MKPVPILQLRSEFNSSRRRHDNGSARALGFFLIIALSASALSCRRGAADALLSNDVVATVAGQSITAAEYQQRLAALGAAASQPGARARLLAEMIETEAMARQARIAGSDQKPEVQRQIKHLLASRYLQDQLALTNRFEPTNLEIQGYYESNLVRFSTPEQIRAALLLLRVPFKCDPEKEQELRARAEMMREAVTSNPTSAAGFGAVALEFSEDQATRYRGGDLGYLGAAELEKRLGHEACAALLSLQTSGDVSPVIQTPAGFYILKLLARQPGTRRPLSEVRPGIVYLLRQAKETAAQKQFASSCTNGLEIHINRALLAAHQPAVAPEVVPALPAVTTASSN